MYSVQSIIERKLHTEPIYNPQNYRFDLEQSWRATRYDPRVIPVMNGYLFPPKQIYSTYFLPNTSVL